MGHMLKYAIKNCISPLNVRPECPVTVTKNIGGSGGHAPLLRTTPGWVCAVCSVQYLNTVAWVTTRASDQNIKLVPLATKSFHLKQVEETIG